LKRAFDASVRHFWAADQAAIYRALNDLQHEGLVAHERVAQQTRPDRKVYHLTPDGLAELDFWLATPAPNLARREPLLVKLFFATRLQPADLRAVLEAELAAVNSELAAFAKIIGELEAQAPAAIASTGASAEALMLGPVLTLGNGVELGLSYRDWLRGLLDAQAAGTLTAGAQLSRLRGLLAAETASHAAP
jgi:DNA-binding PadR family transcriptional regulator